MSSILTSQGVVLATAMAVSGTVILLAFRHQKPTPEILPRPCLSSDAAKRDKKKKKRVHFAEDVVDPSGDGEEFRKSHKTMSKNSSSQKFKSRASCSVSNGGGGKITGMPANREALYNGILRDRVVHRLAYSY